MQGWDKMQPVSCGHFCDHCQKTVIDFTSFSEQELAVYFRKNKEVVCGHFRKEQLNAEIPANPYRRLLHYIRVDKYIATAFIAFTSIVSKAWSQGTNNLQHFEATEQEGKTAKSISRNNSIVERVIKGLVIDSVTGVPVIACEITHEISGTKTLTDLDGKFEIAIPTTKTNDSVTLLFEGPPYLNKRFSFYDESVVVVRLHEDVGNIDGMVIIGRKPTFWQRIKRIFNKRN